MHQPSREQQKPLSGFPDRMFVGVSCSHEVCRSTSPNHRGSAPRITPLSSTQGGRKRLLCPLLTMTLVTYRCFTLLGRSPACCFIGNQRELHSSAVEDGGCSLRHTRVAQDRAPLACCSNRSSLNTPVSPAAALVRSQPDYECVPPLGYGDVLDAVHHLLHFALQLLTAGRLDEIVDSEYIDNLEWFDDLSRVLSGNGSGSAA